MTPLDKVLDRLRTGSPSSPRRAGRGWVTRCPVHDDRAPSLSITEAGDGRVLIHCHAGCATDAVLASVGLGFEDLFPEKRIRARSPRRRRNIAQAARRGR